MLITHIFYTNFSIQCHFKQFNSYETLSFNMVLYFLNRIAAIRCIMSVEQVHDEADESDIVVRRQIGDIVFVVLPKIVNTLTNIATSEETLGETLIAVMTIPFY